MKFESQEIQKHEISKERQAARKRVFMDKKKQLEDELKAMEADSKRLVEEQDTDALFALAKEMEEKKKEIEAVIAVVIDGIKGADSINKDVFLQEWKKYREEYDKTKLQPELKKAIKARQELEEALQKYGDLVTEYRKERDDYNYKYFGGDIQTKYDMGDFHISYYFLQKYGLSSTQLETLAIRTIGNVM